MVLRRGEKVRYAVVGLGWFAQAAILPAFKQAAENSELAALFSGDAEKRRELGAQYKVPAHDYGEIETLFSSGAIDAIYIVTPNTQHQVFALAAAKYGIHVLCEKPLADAASAAQAMLDACKAGGVKLMTAYRLHFEEANLAAIETIKSGQIGEPRIFNSVFTQQVEGANTRLDGDLGVSPLHDIGVYCINAARYLFQADPLEVFATSASSGEPRFRDMPEMYTAILRFPEERLASFTCGYGEASVSSYRVVGGLGDLRLEPAYPFDKERKSFLTIGGATKEKSYRAAGQLAPEILYFSKCVLENIDPEPSGHEGWIDMVVVDALLESAKTGRFVKLPAFAAKPRPSIDQKSRTAATGTQKLINAAPPSGKE